MARRTPATFAKRQREMDKKRNALEKRQKRAEKKAAGPRPPGEEPPYEVCRPYTDE
jgi:DNA invertase Pin-like site-specific DNA recombinase